MQKFTKIIATLGPSSDNAKVIKKLYQAGMNLVRLNFSHGSYEYFADLISQIRKVNPDLPIILDTKGPEIRTGNAPTEGIELITNQKIFLTNQPIIGSHQEISINYEFLGELKAGNHILISDGLIELKIIENKGNKLIAKVLNGGILGSKKNVCIQGHNVRIKFLSDKDIADIKFAIAQKLSFIAASFVRTGEDVDQIQELLTHNQSNIKIISKIEHPDAVKNIKVILEKSYGIMVARGDLGVQIALEKIPQLQRDIIRLCNKAGKPVIVATQMLESMKDNPRPTRAEVSDVANAIIDGADAIMLSGETANGKYPVQAVQTMQDIALEYEKEVKNNISDHIIFNEKFCPNNYSAKKAITLFVTEGAYRASIFLRTQAIFTPSQSGYTARQISRFKPKCPIYALTCDYETFQQLQLSWGVFPIHAQFNNSNLEDLMKDILQNHIKKDLFKLDDLIVITGGYKLFQEGYTNLIEIYKIASLIQL